MDTPWYFEVNGIGNIPDNILGQGSILQVVDNCIDFASSHNLIECHFPSKDDNSCTEYFANHTFLDDTDMKNYVHGTAMASIICAKTGIHSFHENDSSKSYFNDKGIDKILVQGIAPYSKVQGVKSPITPTKIENTIENARQMRQEETSTSTPMFPEFKQSKIILINLSGGERNKGADTEGWYQILADACKDKYTLINAASGNDGCDLNANSHCRIQPAAMKDPRKCGESHAILRIGAINKYNASEIPSLYHSSNYGNNYIDILAPGQLIPSLVPGDFGMLGSGTSQATAVTSGLAAILASCDNNANANEIRNAIIEGSSKYDSLQYAVKDGCVLNMYKTVQKFCYSNDIANGQENIVISKEGDSNYFYLSALAGTVIVLGGIYYCAQNFKLKRD